MKKILSIFLVFGIYQSVIAQNVGIGTTTPDNSAVLDVSSTSKGMLIPRMTTAQKNAIASPATGLIVFDTNLSAFYFYNGSAWVPVSSGGSGDWITSGNNIYNSNSGNVGIGTSTPNTRLHVDGNLRVSTGNLSIDNSIGSFYFRTANQNRGFFEMRGANYDVNIGTSPLNNTGEFSIQTNGLDRMKVLPGGNVGIGISNPLEKLDVNGNIRTNSSLIIDNPNAIMQLKSGGDNKGFMQLSGDNLRLGTNNGNTNGRMVFRFNGVDRMAIDAKGNLFTYLQVPAPDEGNIEINKKISRFGSPDENYLPLAHGTISADASSAIWISPLAGATINKVGTGHYKLKFAYARISPRSSIIVTGQSITPLVCTAKYIAPSEFDVYVYNLNGTLVDGAFAFIVNDPANLF